MDEGYYQDDVVADAFGGVDPGLTASGPWAGLGMDAGIALIEDGPVLQLSADASWLAVSGIAGPAILVRIGLATPF